MKRNKTINGIEFEVVFTHHGRLETHNINTEYCLFYHDIKNQTWKQITGCSTIKEGFEIAKNIKIEV